MSDIKLHNQDGSTTTFNFKFDNGLPFKPIINPSYETGFTEKSSIYILSMYLKDEDVRKLGKLDIEGFAYSSELHEIWLLINEHYVVFGNVSDKIINAISNNNLGFYFLKENGEFIKGRKVGT